MRPENGSKHNWWRRMWERLTESPIETAVRELAPRYFEEFGYKGIRGDYKGIQCEVDLQHCTLIFHYYRQDLGCGIRSHGGENESQQVAETHIPWSFIRGLQLVRNEVEKQMRYIIQKHRAELEGDL